MSQPNQISLSGNGITVTYWPDGFGPVLEDGRTFLVYTARHREQRFTQGDVTTTNAPGLGQLVTVTLETAPGASETTFTLIVPSVEVPDEIGGEVALSLPAITATSAGPEVPNEPSLGYKVEHLSGSAATVEIPLVEAGRS